VGLIDELDGHRIFLDTAPFIYFIERHDKYLSLVKPVFNGIDNEKIDAITSTVTLLEVLVHPLKTRNKELAEQYREILLFSGGLTTYEIQHSTSERAALLRAKYTIKAPDALQVAVGILYGAEKFVTNDPQLKKIKEIDVIIIDDYLKEDTG